MNKKLFILFIYEICILFDYLDLEKNTTFKIIINSSYIILPINCSIIFK